MRPMDKDVLSLIESWDGCGVVTRFDRPTGTWIFIALHDNTMGNPAGGTRMKIYPALADGLLDAMRLAEGMTHKWAGLKMDYGGGKAVLALARPLEDEERAGLLRRYGSLITSLNGTFRTGVDLGTTAADMATIASTCPHVLGIDYDTMSSTDPGPFTAHGVFCGLKAAVEQAFGSADLAGRSVLIQGVGGVGGPLARFVAEAGGKVLLSDLDVDRAKTLAGELEGQTVETNRVYSTPCDVYAPCAVGATINSQTVPQLACRVVAGSANNQLLESEDAERLHRRGILYAPDYVINAGGAMAFSLMKDGENDPAALMRRVEGVGTAITEIMREAATSNASTLQAAQRRVTRILDQRRQAAS